jgi:hypothetical protein
MAVDICGFNSLELSDQELMDDGLNLFVCWDLGDMFGDLLLSRDLTLNNESGELDQVASLLNVNVDALYKMSNYWDKAQETEHLSRFDNETDRMTQLNIIQENNRSLFGNIDHVHETVIALESSFLNEEDLKYVMQKVNPDFYDEYNYFSKQIKPYSNNLLLDLVKIKEFIEFVKRLNGDTLYFKFKSGMTS